MDRVRELISEIETFGINNNVPIMSKDTIKVISDIINKNNITSILEIGTAIGYSTICFASIACVKKIKSIERDENRYNIAINNVKKSNFSNIELVLEDALNIEENDKYDLIIIDAAKSQNMKFFNKFSSNLNKNGIIIIDNLNFHGFVHSDERIQSRNLRQMVKKIEKFIDFLNEQNEYEVKFIEVGDTIGVCKKKDF